MTDTTTETLPPETASDDEFLLAFLNSHESPCPACGYNCHKIVSPRCPECGLPLTLRVAATLPLRKSWILLLLATATTAGMGGLVLGYMAFHGWPHTNLPALLSRAVFVYFIAMIPSPAATIGLRRWFSNFPRDLRASLAALFVVWTCILLWLLFIA